MRVMLGLWTSFWRAGSPTSSSSASPITSEGGGLKRFVKENSLSLFFFAIFVLALVGQAIAGHDLFNDEQLEHKEPAVNFWRYLS